MFLLTEVQDKLLKCIQLLQKDGLLEQDLSVREVYDKHLHPNILPLDIDECWDALEKGSVISIFQFESEVGKAAAAKIKPRTITELADANGSSYWPQHTFLLVRRVADMRLTGNSKSKDMRIPWENMIII